MFGWRTENVRCVELIPAGLEASAETEGTVDILGPLEVSCADACELEVTEGTDNCNSDFYRKENLRSQPNITKWKSHPNN